MRNTIALLFFTILTTNIMAQMKNFIDLPYLETTARVDSMVVPDEIYLNIFLSEGDTKNKVSVEKLEKRMAEKLTSLGIDLKEQLTLNDLSSDFRKYFLKQKNIEKTKSYTLKVYDAITTGKVLLGLEEVGISNVSLLKTEYSKMEELHLELKSKAVQKAKTQADYLLKPLNQKVVKAIHITDHFYYPYRNTARAEMMVGAVSDAKQSYEPIDVDFQLIKVQSEVNVKFQIE